MSDNIPPEIKFQDPPAEEDVEILVEGQDPPPEPEKSEEEEIPEELKKMSKAEIAKKLQEVSESANQTRQLNETLNESIQSLGEKLQPQQQQQQQQEPQQQPQEEFNEEDFEQNFFKKPLAKSLDEYTQKKIAPLLRDTLSGAIATQRQLLSIDPTTKDFFGKHAGEIDAEFQKLGPQDKISGQGYQKAYNIIRAQHSDEIISEEVKKQVEAFKTEIRAELTKDKDKDESTVTETHPGNVSSGARQKKRVYLTKQDKILMEDKGMTPQEFVRWKERNNG